MMMDGLPVAGCCLAVRFCDRCAASNDLPGLLTLARTRSRWEDEITAAVLTG